MVKIGAHLRKLSQN